MAYYIFLKSLRSLEKFRKNPHVKISPKSPSTNFQSLDKFKNRILIRKFIFLIFGPLATLSPAGRKRLAGPSSPRRSRLHEKYVFLFRSRLPEPAASSLCHCYASPACRLHRLHHAGRPRSGFSPPRHSPAPRMPPSVYSPPSSLPPLNLLQTER
jgi:hypothetical protein